MARGDGWVSQKSEAMPLNAGMFIIGSLFSEIVVFGLRIGYALKMKPVRLDPNKPDPDDPLFVGH